MHITSNRLIGGAWMLTDALIMSLLLLVGGILSSQTNPLQVVFVVNTLAALFALIIFSKGRWIYIRPNKPRLHLYRGLLGVCSTSCIFWALQQLTLIEVTAINFLVPILTSLASVFLFKEKPQIAIFISLFVSLLGVLLILYPDFSQRDVATNRDIYKGLLFSSGAVITLVVYNINLKNIGNQEKVIPQMIFGPAFSALILLPVVIDLWKPLNPMAWRLAALYGLLLMLKLAVRFWAFQKSDVLFLMPFEYSQMLFSSLLGYFFLAQGISIYSIAGMFLVFSSNAFLFRSQFAKSGSSLGNIRKTS